MKKLVLLVALLLLVGCGSGSTVVFAEETNSLSLSGLLSKVKINSGIGYDFQSKEVVNTQTIKILEYDPKEKPTNKFLSLISKDNLNPSVDVGYTTKDKAVIGLSFSALKLSKYGVQIPVLDLVDLRPFVQYSFSHLTTAKASNIDNSWIAGFTIISVQF
jgi:hypothetical protein